MGQRGTIRLSSKVDVEVGIQLQAPVHIVDVHLYTGGSQANGGQF